jgi:FAD:protein FMN transferase
VGATLQWLLHPGWVMARFEAMASPCELLFDVDVPAEVEIIAQAAAAETWRIEQALSRYRRDNLIDRINRAQGQRIRVDDELAAMLDFADQLYRLSGGLFDVTSGVLRRIWRFDGSANLPEAQQVAAVLPLVGWNKVHWQRPYFAMPAGMEIDLGGIGKEYAVDKVFGLIASQFSGAFLVNFGGDLRARGPRRGGLPWQVGLEKPDQHGVAVAQYALQQGALTTSGDSRRFLLKEGVRYSHILDPRTGWPIQDAPRSITVLANTCTEAGVLSTLGLLQGRNAENFLRQQGVKFWCLREHDICHQVDARRL